ncbi:hypothetical protein VB005_02508 [Metarhizium brunneum]
MDEALRRLRASTTPFGGIHVVLFTGDFFQFGPVLQKSILFPCDSWTGNLSVTALNHQHAHELWLKFKRVVILQEQVRAGGDPALKRLLTKLRNFQQDSSDLALINSRVLKDGKIPYDENVRVITPLNRHRWDLNTQAVMMWAKRMGRKVSIFLSTHKWTKERPSEEEMMRVFEQGDDKDCPIPAIFVYADGMPVIVNEKLYLGLRVVNGSVFRAAGIVPDRQHQPVRANIVVPDAEGPGADMVSEMSVNIYFGPPSAILLESKSTANLSFPGIPPGTVMVCRKKATMVPTRRNRLRMRCQRQGLPCAPGFVMTDFKAQSKTMAKAVLGLYGYRLLPSGEPSACEYTTAYVQLSRCTSFEGMRLLREVRPVDFLNLRLDEKKLAASPVLSANNYRVAFYSNRFKHGCGLMALGAATYAIPLDGRLEANAEDQCGENQ